VLIVPKLFAFIPHAVHHQLQKGQRSWHRYKKQPKLWSARKDFIQN